MEIDIELDVRVKFLRVLPHLVKVLVGIHDRIGGHRISDSPYLDFTALFAVNLRS